MSGSTARRSRMLQYKIDNEIIQLKEMDYDDGETGWAVWRASEVMARWIAQNKYGWAWLEGKRIMEVGSGLGLGAVTLMQTLHKANVRPDELIFTDGSEAVIKQLNENVSQNSVGLCGARVSIKRLQWDQLDSVPPRSYDLIFGADIVYDDEHPLLVSGLLTHSLANSMASVGLISLAVRRLDLFKEFVRRCEAVGLLVHLAPVDVSSCQGPVNVIVMNEGTYQEAQSYEGGFVIVAVTRGVGQADKGKEEALVLPSEFISWSAWYEAKSNENGVLRPSVLPGGFRLKSAAPKTSNF